MRIIAINLCEMAGAGDIVKVSIPFAAGVASAAFFPPGESLLPSAATAAMAATIISLIFAFRKGASVPSLCICFFFCGVFCSLTRMFTGIQTVPPLEGTDKAMERLCSFIDSIGFGYSNTAPLAKALFTGTRKDIPEETIQAFRDSGAAHILALSGLHMGIIYSIASYTLAILGNSRTAALFRSTLIILAAGAFTRMTGSGPSTVRAFLFITLNEISRHAPGRRRSPISVFCIALMIQLCYNPLVIKSLGFQLSYLAMLGIFTVYPRLESWYPQGGRFDIMRKIWCSMALSVSCQLFTAPLVLLRFGTLPRYFLLTNLIALPVTEAFMMVCFADMVFSGLGWCPEIIKSPADHLARALIYCLETIAGL